MGRKFRLLTGKVGEDERMESPGPKEGKKRNAGRGSWSWETGHRLQASLTGSYADISVAISSYISIKNTDISIRSTAGKEGELKKTE